MGDRKTTKGARQSFMSCGGAEELHERDSVTGLVVGGWWLVVGGWWLVVGGWWLVVGGGWWLVVGGWWLVVGEDILRGETNSFERGRVWSKHLRCVDRMDHELSSTSHYRYLQGGRRPCVSFVVLQGLLFFVDEVLEVKPKVGTAPTQSRQ